MLLFFLVWKAAANANIGLPCFRCQSDKNGFTTKSCFINSFFISVKLIVNDNVGDSCVLTYWLHRIQFLDDDLGSWVEPCLFGIDSVRLG